MPKVIIDGKEIEVADGTMLIEAVAKRGVSLPALCNDPRLEPSSSCRLCEVDVRGRQKSACACATPVEDGMVVETQSERLVEFRRTVLGFFADKYPRDAALRSPEKDFHRHLREHGLLERTVVEKPVGEVDDAHPYIHVDMSQCVHCYRCIRICEELQGQFVWGAYGHGEQTRVLPDSGSTLKASSCVSCGACVDTCPSGALEDKTILALGAPEAWQRTTCPYCGVGCELSVGVSKDRIVAVRPVLDAPVSKGHLCVKGRYSTGFVDAADRITTPMVRKNGAWTKVSWNEALDAAADALRRTRDAAGADANYVLGSARATNEECYLIAKLARVALGTNNVDCCARVCHAPSAAGLAAVFGAGAATNSFDDIEDAAAIMVVGANPLENHPIVGARIRQRALAGVPLIVIDPRRTELAAQARLHLQLKPGTNIPLLNAMAAVIITEGLANMAFVEERCEGLVDFANSVAAWPADRAAKECGVDAELIRKAARLYAGAKPASIFNGLGVTEHIQGTEAVMALASLALLTGNVGVRGGGVNPLRGQNNVQGAANMGCEPSKLTGYQPIAKARSLHETVWQTQVPDAPGLTAMEMIEAATAGRLACMLVAGYDVLLSHPNAKATHAALAKLDALIVIDLFMTKTAEAYGTVFLPAVSSFEKDGTFMNGERRIQRVRRAVSPRGEAKTDLEIACALAQRLGHGAAFQFSDAEAVWNEVRAVWPAVAGISYARLEHGGIQWPCPTESHPGTRVLHEKSFGVGPRAKLRPIDYRPSAEQPSDEYPFVLNTGRTLYHFNASTMTGHSKNRELGPDDFVQVHPNDAERLQIRNGASIRVRSQHGSFVGRAQLTDAVRPGELFSTFHDLRALVNDATGRGRDSVTSTPEYKVTAVTLEPVSA
ncbi:MAG: formate dehydrogenase subunit alpha [Deltaproteobacteria bacterium]|nr:formate dehydrogenase subunit alpha [Deltaproteobacteria bacterium]